MKKISQYRLPKEELLLPFYLSDSHFTSLNDYLAEIDLLPETLSSEKVDLFTTLNAPLDQLDPTKISSIIIPVYGWGETADYFFQESFFKKFNQDLLNLMQSWPQVKIILEYQINCFSLEALKQFMQQFSVFRVKHPHPGGIELHFNKRFTPNYLDVMVVEDSWKDWIQECLEFMQTSKQFDRNEVLGLKHIAEKIKAQLKTNDFGPNAKKQILCTFYYYILSRKTKAKTIASFPRTLPLLKKAAIAFLEINPPILKNEYFFKKASIEKYHERLNEKILSFKTTSFPNLLDDQKDDFLLRILRVKDHVACEHNDLDMLEVLSEILRFPLQTKGVIVEAGLFKGGGTAKLSIASATAGRKLVAFDSFRGLPSHEEASPHLLYPPGVYYGSKNEVIHNLKNYGEVDGVELVEGWFEETLPKFNQAVAIAYLDVDLASSTKVCLRYLWPLLAKGGMIFSHDGHLPDVAKIIHDPEFWRCEFGESIPEITKVHSDSGFIKIQKK